MRGFGKRRGKGEMLYSPKKLAISGLRTLAFEQLL